MDYIIIIFILVDITNITDSLKVGIKSRFSEAVFIVKLRRENQNNCIQNSTLGNWDIGKQ